MQRVALITGGNRGIGFEVCRQLAEQGIQVILGSRDSSKGKVAAGELQNLTRSQRISYCPLDVDSPDSIDRIRGWIAKDFQRLDILVNNAGVFLDGKENGHSLFETPASLIEDTFRTNTMGPIRLIQELAPLMKQNRYGRIVNVSSGMGQLTEMEGGWPGYRISKTAINAVTRIAAAELKDFGILVNSVCPGWVRTDMGGADADRSVEQGAETIVWLANLPNDGPTGGFFRDRKPISW